MIDAVRFSTSFTAFWKSAAPMCELFVKKLNLHLYERVDAPMAESETRDRAFIAEFAFALFVELRSAKVSTTDQLELRKKAEDLARRKISLLSGSDVAPDVLSEEQTGEVREIAKRLNSFFFTGGPAVSFRPSFPGCGIIDRSEGDVLIGTTLYEVKTVSRSFRGSDIRQLIVYCALNSLSKENVIDAIGLYNPRAGVSFSAPLDLIAREISGKPYGDLFEDIYQAISSGGISR